MTDEPTTTTPPPRPDPAADRARALRNAARAADKARQAEATENAAVAFAISLGASLREVASATGRSHTRVQRQAERAGESTS